MRAAAVRPAVMTGATRPPRSVSCPGSLLQVTPFTMASKPHRLHSRNCKVFAGQGSVDSQSSSRDDEYQYEFGKPAAPKETWQRFANEARAALLEEMGKADWEIDVLQAALALACEDDAVHGRSVVKLPTDSYSKRVNVMVDELKRIHLPRLEDPTAKAKLDCVDHYLYDLQKFKRAEGVLEVYSPYRMYAHHVLAQKCGTSASLAVVHLSVLQRLKAAGCLDGVDFQLVLPTTGHRPFARVMKEGDGSPSAMGVTITPRIAILMMLDALKRSFWPWEWPVGAKSGFLPAAQAAIGVSGRIGTANSTTGVLQASGRPFGDLSRSLLATERLVLLKGSNIHIRDTGILFYHLKRYEEAYDALRAYRSKVKKALPEPEEDAVVPEIQQRMSIEGMRTELQTIADEKDLVDKVISKLERMKAESSWAL